MVAFQINIPRQKSLFSLLCAALAVIVQAETASAACGDYLHSGAKKASPTSTGTVSHRSILNEIQAADPLAKNPIPDSPCRRGNCHDGSIPTGPLAPLTASTVDRDNSGLDATKFQIGLRQQSGRVRSIDERPPLNPALSIDRPPK